MKTKVICGTIIEKEGKFLLVKETKEGFEGVLNTPAGFLEPGETLEEAAIRETKEETGADVEVVGLNRIIHVRVGDESHFLKFVFDSKIIGEPNLLDETVWVSKDEIINLDTSKFKSGEILRKLLSNYDKKDKVIYSFIDSDLGLPQHIIDKLNKLGSD